MTSRSAADGIEATQIAALFGIEIQTAIPVSGGFSGACIFRVEDFSGSVFALRRTPIGDALPTTRYCDLLTLLGDVYSNGCTVIPVPLRHQQVSLGMLSAPNSLRFANADNSQTRIRSDKFLWQMEPWMPGESVEGYPTAGQVESTLEALALFHKTAAESIRARGNNQTFRLSLECSPGVERRISLVSELTRGLLSSFLKAAASEPDPDLRNCGRKLCNALELWLPWLTKRLTDVSGVSFSLQPTIRDLWRPHVLFSEERLTGIIDLNAMATDHVGLDMTRLLRSWFGADVASIRETIHKFMVQRSFDEKTQRLLQALDASTVLLSPVRWLRELYGADQRRRSESVIARIHELSQIAEQFEPL